MEPRIIKNDEQYEHYLKEVERLTLDDPDAESPSGHRLELLAKLIEDYEKSHYRFRKPDPIEAIVFRMEEQGLRQKDLAPLLGGSNRVSEVLAGKRTLTLPMIRALHECLEIPLELLILESGEQSDLFEEFKEFDESDIPVEELVKRGWVDARVAASEVLKRFGTPLGTPVLLRHTKTFGRQARTKIAHIWLWLSRVREIADAQTHVSQRFQPSELNEDLLRYVAKLSYMDRGPRLAKDFLEENGIVVVIEPHLRRTHLDGAALLGRHGAPVIGLTLRQDRLDNFWFTLLHELVHAWRHLDVSNNRAIADEDVESGSDDDIMEREANTLARDVLIPTVEWRQSEAYLSPSPASIRALARELQISPAIVAGRVRYETQDYSAFSKLVGLKQVRRHFPEVRWT